jgi:hypothetical protein
MQCLDVRVVQPRCEIFGQEVQKVSCHSPVAGAIQVYGSLQVLLSNAKVPKAPKPLNRLLSRLYVLLAVPL